MECTARTTECHSHCEKYKEWKAEKNRLLEIAHEKKKLDMYFGQSIYRNSRINFTK